MRTGFIFFGIYLLFVGLIALFVVTAESHMSFMFWMVPTFPWSLLSVYLFRSHGFPGGVLIGGVVNAMLAFVLGVAVSRLRRR